MLTWIAVKTFFKKTWEVIKEYWKYVLALVYGIGVWVFFKGQSEKTKEVLETAKDSHKKQIDEIEEIHKQEIEERDRIIEDYTKIIENIEKKYSEESKKLSNKKKEDIKKLVEEHGKDPGVLASKLSDEYGFLYVASGETE